MTPSRLSPTIRSQVAESVRAAPAAARAGLVRRTAETLGVSAATIYRLAGLGGPARRRAPARRDYRDWVRTALRWSHRAPDLAPLDVAIGAAVEAGELPPEAADMPLPTARRIIRELGLTRQAKRTHRLHAAWPMQAVQLDASTSKHLVVDGADAGEGEATRLRLHRGPLPARGYKNKPLPPDRRRLLVCGLWDMCTGVTRSRYHVAVGETALGAIEFVCWALARSADPRVVLHGVPDHLWVDQGPLLKWAPALDLLDRLEHVHVEGDGEPDGVHVVTGAPYQKTRMGGVERSHRTRWHRFESALFLRREQTITLGELNARLLEFEVREHGRRLSRTPVDGRELSRTAAWVALTNRRPAGRELRRLPNDPLRTLAERATRRVDVNGIVRWGGERYECGQWHDREVTCWRAADGSGDLVLEDPRTGERAPARRFAPRPYGEVRAARPTGLDKLLGGGAGDGEREGADVYAPGRAAAVVPMPARTAPPAPLDDPLDGGRCRDLAEALRVFVELYPHPLSPGEHAQVSAYLERRGLRRQAVADLAQTLLAARRRA